MELIPLRQPGVGRRGHDTERVSTTRRGATEARLTSARYFVVAAFPGSFYVAGSKNGAESRDVEVPARTWFKPY